MATTTRWATLRRVGACWVLGSTVALAQGQDGAAQRLPFSDTPRGTRHAAEVRLELPARSREARGGTAVLADLQGLGLAEREARVEAELERGNLPDVLRAMQPVVVRGRGGDGREHTITLHVTPDYLAVGSDDDFVRMPLTPRAAQRIADRLGCLLPTRTIVDLVYQQAEVKLAPNPMTPGPNMVRPAAFVAHHRRIEDQLQEQGARPGALIAGHKKDVVNSNRLRARPDRVAIYGWHRLDGRAIQPLSTVHDWGYVDYSHGIRLVHGTAVVDGEPQALADVLRDPALAPLLSDEGPLASARVP